MPPLPALRRLFVAVSCALALPALAPPARATTTLTPTDDVTALVAAFAGAGVHVLAATLESGTVVAAGPGYNALTATPTKSTATFVSGPLGLARGALLTSGDATLALPPNATLAGSLDGASGVHGADALDDDAFCDQVIGNPLYRSKDVVRLTLDFTLDAGFDGVEVSYVFGSEEFPDYLATLYPDAFGIFVRAAGTAGFYNIGLDTLGNPVNINGPFFSGTKVISAMPVTGDPTLSGYNGLTPRITNGVELASGPTHVHQLVLVVCDASDRYLDSGLFVKSIAGCSGACSAVRFCGNGVVDPGELCDDGNNVNTDGCTNGCSPCADDHPGGERDHGCTAALPVCAAFDADLATCQRCDDDTHGALDSGCATPLPACLRDGTGAGGCVACTEDADCATACDLATHTCTACADTSLSGVDTGCSAALPACDEAAPGGPSCVGCTADAQCGASVCTAQKACAPCEDSLPNGARDHGCAIAAPICDDAGTPLATCVPCVDDTPAALDTGCSAATPDCNELAPGGHLCVGCVADGCDPGRVCATTGACVVCEDSAPGASKDAGCPAAAPICIASGTAAARCVPCVDDQASSTDTGCSSLAPACYPQAPGGPTCVGCTSDGQCGCIGVCGTGHRCVACEDSASGGALDRGCVPAVRLCLASGTPAAHCVPCVDDTPANTDSGCAAALPACDVPAVGDPTCRGCTTDLQCAPAGKICATNAQCGLCEDTAPGAARDDGCGLSQPLCAASGTLAAHCVRCLDDTATGTDTGCAAILPACDEAATGGPQCASCTVSAQCPAGTVCDPLGVCSPCSDTDPLDGTDAGCTGAAPLCIQGGTAAAHCVPCVDDTPSATDLGCSAALPACDEAATGGPSCVGCTTDAQCVLGALCGDAGDCVVCADTAPGAGRDAGCDLPAPLCADADSALARCVPCLDDQAAGVDSGCVEALPYCFEAGDGARACFPCANDADCAADERCGAAHACEQVPDRPPLALDDAVAVEPGVAVLMAVLANDHDPEGQAVTLSAALVTEPTAGTVTIFADGSVLYTPDPDSHGQDSFVYEVCDPAGLCDTATVTVSVGAPAAPTGEQHPPVAMDDVVTITTTGTGAGTGAVTLEVRTNDHDVDGDTLTVTAVGEPGHGTVTVESSGELTYTPEPGFVGTDVFTYTVDDGHGGSASARVVVTVQATPNGPPVASDDAFSVAATVPTALDVTVNDVDPDGDPLEVVDVTEPAHGVITFGEDGLLLYTPEAGFCGEVVVRYTVRDPGGAEAQATVRLGVGDRDQDGLCDTDEAAIGTDPDDPDSDGDGLGDGVEHAGVTDPLDADTDDDGLSDGDEGTAGLDPIDPDSDDDGLSDGLEEGVDAPVPGGTSDGRAPVAFAGTDTASPAWQPDADPTTTTDPRDDDSDDDGLLDGHEDADHDGALGPADGAETDPNAPDSDGDGLLDGTERGLAAPQGTGTDLLVFVPDADPTTTTDPRDADTDHGGVPDGVEDSDHNGRVDAGERDPLDPADDVPVTQHAPMLEGGGGCAGAGAGPLGGALFGLALALVLAKRRRQSC